MDFLTGLAQAFIDVFQPLSDALATPSELGALLRQEGWRPPDAGDWFTPLSTALALAGDIDKAVMALQTVIDDGSLSIDDVRKALDAGGKVLSDLRAIARPTSVSLPSPLDEDVFWTTFPADLVQDLVFRYFERAHPAVFAPLHLLGVLDEAKMMPAADEHTRLPYLKRTIRWDRLATAATNPSTLPADIYGWGTTFDHVTLLVRLERVMRAFDLAAARHLPVEALARAYYPSTLPNALKVLRVTLIRMQDGTSFVESGLLAVPIPPAGTTDAPNGVFVGPYVYGNVSTSVPLDGPWSLQLSGGLETSGVVGIEIRPGKTSARINTTAATFDLALRLVAKPATPWILIGNEDSDHLACTELEIGVELTGTPDDPDLKLRLHTDGLQVVFDPSAGDSFVTSTCGTTPTPSQASVDIIWSSKTGLHIDGQVNLSIVIPLGVPIGPITIQQIHLAVTSTTNDVTLLAGVSVGAVIGPVQVSVSDIGVMCTFTPMAAPARGTFGDLDAEFGFKSPSGVGLAIDVAGLTGGGFLSHDEAASQYAGMLQLAYRQFQLQAFGLITTVLPTGPGYSLVAMIDATFPPIELVAGFTLNGVGGLLGVNRTVSTDALEAGIKAHTLSNFLFVKNAVANAPQLLTDLQTFFPAASGSYVFGPLLQIGWGTPTVLTMNLALLLALPDPVRLVLLGELDVLLPDPKAVVLEMHMDLLGTIDFTADEGSLDADLHDSRLVRYPLMGAMAMRACWAGSSKEFLLAIGGFNPAFQPPASFPTLPRVAINMKSGSIAKLNLAGYVAVTSNTLQVGANIDLAVGVDGFGISGYLNFDTLIQFSPFHFEADISGGIELSAGGDDLMSLDLAASMSGPNPWHVAGKVHFSILGFGVSKSFSETFGDSSTQPALQSVDVGAALRAALGDPRNYSASLTTNQNGLVSLRAPTSTGVAFGHPAASLNIDQKIVPLGLTIAKFGAAPPQGDTFFTITATTVDGNTANAVSLKGEFAPAQFLDLSDDQELSSPSFESFDAGVTVAQGAWAVGEAMAGSAVIERTVAYETYLIDTPGGQPRELTGVTPVQPTHMIPVLSGLLNSGTLRYAGPSQSMVRASLGYVVATTNQIAVSGVGVTTGQTYAQARGALVSAVAQNPNQLGALQVVPLYEVPST